MRRVGVNFEYLSLFNDRLIEYFPRNVPMKVPFASIKRALRRLLRSLRPVLGLPLPHTCA